MSLVSITHNLSEQLPCPRARPCGILENLLGTRMSVPKNEGFIITSVSGEFQRINIGFHHAFPAFLSMVTLIPVFRRLPPAYPAPLALFPYTPTK